MTGTPIDQPARDRIRTQIDANMCVEAGAGTGKTTILVSRILEIIRTGYATMDSLVVITFTEKAAAELATRVRESLERALDAASDEQEIQRYDEALRGLYRARIETIHAFASSLLRERPVEAGLDPNFEVLDRLRADLSFDERFRAWINEYLDTDGAGFDQTRSLRRALNRGFQLRDMQTVCLAVHNHRYILPLTRIDVPEPDVFGFRESLREGAVELRTLVHSCVNPDDRGLPQIESLLDLARRCDRAGDDRYRLERILLAASLPSSPGGNKNNWDPKEACDRQKEIRRDLAAELAQLQADLKASALTEILPLAEEFVRDYEERRRAAGQAEFEDLLIWARDLLRDKLHVRADFQNRFDCVLVDEFQDTDPLQVEIVMYLASEGQQASDWTELRPTPGKLFVVGDPKQSIYRFRRADIAIYQQVKEEILADSVEVIQQNFRSVPGVLQWVNALFSQLIQPEERTQPEYIRLEPSLEPVDADSPPVIVVHSQEPSGYADGIRSEEARLLARTIRHAVEDAQWPVRDPESGEHRPAEYRDFAVLLPTRTGLDFFEEAFGAARIPYRHEGGREYFQRQEIRDLRACLRAIDNPGDRLSMVAALRSSAFGCSDEDLYQYLQDHGRFDYRDGVGDGSVVADSLRILKELHDSRKHLTLPEVVERVIERTNLVEFALTQPNGGDQSAGNLLKMVDQARAFTAAQGGGLRAFVRWTVTSAETRSDEADAAVAEETDNVVRLMTIHGAKGLEFPIVALANLHRGSTRASNQIPNFAEGRLDLSISGFQTPGYEAAKEYEARHGAAEQLRLFYVAATRASNYLVLPIAAQPEKAGGLLEHVVKFVPQLSEENAGREIDGQLVLDPAVLPPLEQELPGRTSPVTPEEVAEAHAERARWFELMDRLCESGNTPRRIVTASSQKSWERPAGLEYAVDPSTTSQPVERNSALRIGNALHGALERIDLRDPQHVDGLVRAALRDAEIPSSDTASEARVRRMVGNVLESQLVARIQASTGHVAQEVEFGYGMHHDTGLAQGQMDVMFIEDGQVVIADFKSDNIPPDAVEARTWDREHGYFGQAAVYAYVAHRITGLPVREVIFYYAEPNVAESIPGEELMAPGEEIVERQGTSADLGTEIASS